MINNNKILTVSYGTFSCTLEGFDDSFGTMKAIAEYFRDLSADDRYFGAEPAQPDAQMLARIAQREISRHVEAREDEGRIVLSAQEAQQAEKLLGDAAEEVEIETTAPKAKAAALAESEPQIEEVVAAEAERETALDDTPVEIEAEAVVAEEVEELIEVDEPDIVPSLPDADVEAFFAASLDADDAEQEEEQPAVIAAAEPAQEKAKADSIADKLKRIRAVVSQQSEADADPAYSEDQHADATALKAAAAMTPLATLEEEAAELGADEESDVIADTLRDLEDALDADDAAEAQNTPAEDLESEDDDITAILNRLEQEADHTSEAPVEVDDADMDDDILAAMDSLVAAPEGEDLDDLDDGSLFDGGDDIEDIADIEEVEEAAPVAPRARVLKVKRATLEAAIRAGQLEEYDDEEGNVEAEPIRKAPLAKKSTLSDQAEEELARELAELEADMKAEEISEAVQEVEPEAPEDVAKPVDDQIDIMSDIHGDADDDLSRLMAETDSQMDEPEGANRRDAFAHLRAAVAAKKADEAVGGSLDEQGTDEAYRDDLASVVRPRRPASGSGSRVRTERPSEKRPAPLKLVAEQRIDVKEKIIVKPVRPRRVAKVVKTQAAETAPGATSFVDFAAEVGATKLPDILEAAAAYLSFVEGLDQFSRPQLMTKVRQVEKEDFTREDSLRSFGKLLREGKIEKLKGGRFQASDQIAFQPEARAAS
ncbi:hypothetical protein [Sulfitobacter donghicola]|uniref:Chemotaxis protein CheA n=1 Tax=Sulfitobacter donghicola DSW-25 = KCTC 12864 = JCM 14565 TaxID=1300350 RepID=A0A073IXA1_9RHOB|nr:hypothetical protein [Sulfitobacter donghicola]KEJ89997.1 hypothetical protein DSW25_07225 [Sulfitobacter donghicola DSW-25 = KCTC 12864 = JCM 14565]KIN66873.1 putative, lipoprotein [Sulfitobacter donghicola DSW-25 = KCTC 12864 = JCM 14565]